MFVLHEVDDRRTRLIVRSRIASFQPAWLSALMTRLMIEPSQFIMERRMLIGIKERAENCLFLARELGPPPGPLRANHQNI